MTDTCYLTFTGREHQTLPPEITQIDSLVDLFEVEHPAPNKVTAQGDCSASTAQAIVDAACRIASIQKITLRIFCHFGDEREITFAGPDALSWSAAEAQKVGGIMSGASPFEDDDWSYEITICGRL